jgi:hypothetical protein
MGVRLRLLLQRNHALDGLLRGGQSVRARVELPVRARPGREDAADLLLRALLQDQHLHGLSHDRLPLRAVRQVMSARASVLPLRISAYGVAVAGAAALAIQRRPDLGLPALGLVAGWSAAWSP